MRGRRKWKWNLHTRLNNWWLSDNDDEEDDDEDSSKSDI